MNPADWSAHRKKYLWWMESWRRAALNNKKAQFILERYQKRPVIELYNVKNDPYELVNLAMDPIYEEVMDLLHHKLIDWMKSQNDKGKVMEMNIDIRE